MATLKLFRKLLAISSNLSYLGSMDVRRHGWLVGAVAALALGAFAPAASAATATITDDGTTQVLHVDAAAGEVNNLWIEGGPQWQVAELQARCAGGTPVHIDRSTLTATPIRRPATRSGPTP